MVILAFKDLTVIKDWDYSVYEQIKLRMNNISYLSYFMSASCSIVY